MDCFGEIVNEFFVILILLNDLWFSGKVGYWIDCFCVVMFYF